MQFDEIIQNLIQQLCVKLDQPLWLPLVFVMRSVASKNRKCLHHRWQQAIESDQYSTFDQLPVYRKKHRATDGPPYLQSDRNRLLEEYCFCRAIGCCHRRKSRCHHVLSHCKGTSHQNLPKLCLQLPNQSNPT